jgi:hypothetical protein
VAGVLGIVGGALMWAAYAPLAGGALPFAAATWWSAITPVRGSLPLLSAWA